MGIAWLRGVMRGRHLYLSAALLPLACGARDSGDFAESGAAGGDGAVAASGASSGASAASGSAASTGSDPCDVDGDGHASRACGGGDCNDDDATIHPGAADLNAAIGSWTSGPVGPGANGDIRATPTIALDRSGTPHISYALEGLVHATNASGEWLATPVAGDALDGPAVQVDADGGPRIAFVVPGQGVTLAASYATGSWEVAPLDPDGDGSVAMAIAPSGAVHLAYTAGEIVRHATNATRGWSGSDVAVLAEAFTSIAIGPDGTVHVAYSGDEVLHHARREGGAWTKSLVSTGAPRGASVAIDGSGAVHLSWCDYKAEGGVRYGRPTGDTWEITAVGSEGGPHTSIALDPGGAAAIAFSDIQVHLALQVAGSWTVQSLMVGWSGGVDMAIDLAGATHVAYSDFLFSMGTFVGYATNRVLAVDGVDQNCDGLDGVDADGDGHASLATGGDDCDDTTPGGPC